jgi:hypothetical protein
LNFAYDPIFLGFYCFFILDVTLQNLKNFLKKNTELYIGLAGCLEDFDKLAAEFITKLPNPKTVQARGEELSKSLKAVDAQVSIAFSIKA